MDYLCAYYWQEERDISLVLKHLVFHNTGIPVVFGGLAEGKESKCAVDAMVEWFHAKGLGLCTNSEEGMEKLKRSLAEEFPVISGQLKAVAILICVGRYFLLWSKGKQKIWLLNTRFGRPHARCLLSDGVGKDGEIISGLLEPGVGILMATENFLKGISEEQLVQCVAVKELQQESRVQKRLHEVGEEAKRKGEKHLGGMLIVTC